MIIGDATGFIRIGLVLLDSERFVKDMFATPFVLDGSGSVNFCTAKDECHAAFDEFIPSTARKEADACVNRWERPMMSSSKVQRVRVLTALPIPN